MQTVALREVRSAARRPATYWMRAAAGGIGGLVLVCLAAAEGRTMFIAAIVLGFVLCLLEGVRQGSASIVEERVEGTLGLLLLTRLRGSELLLGKFMALTFFGLQSLLAVTPILAISIIMGGVSLGEFARATLGLGHALLVAMTAGLVISARSRDSSKAMMGTFFLLFGGATLLSLRYWPVAGWPGFFYNTLNPFTPIWKISDLSYAQFKLEYWLCLLITTVAEFLILRAASKRLFRNFILESETKGRPTAKEFAENPIPFQRAPRTADWFNGNPLEWLTVRNLRMQNRVLLPTILALAAGAGILMTGYFGILLSVIMFLVFGFLYSAGASMTFARARQSGEIELWLTTPLNCKEIIKGHLAAIRNIFFWPGLILVIAWAALIYFSMLKPVLLGSISGGVSIGGNQSDPLWVILFWTISSLLSFVSLLFALPYVAMWIALKTKNPAQAAIRTFLLMCICPWLIFFIPKVLIFVPVALVASHSVRHTLKNFATKGGP